MQTIYSYLGYYNVCNLGGEMKNPERNIPRAIFISILGITVLYLAMQTSILTVIPWREAQTSSFIASTFIERAYGSHWATLATVLILLTALGSVFSAMLGYSHAFLMQLHLTEISFQFFRVSIRKKRFPYISLLALGGVSILVCVFFSLISVIRAILAMRCLIQFVGQAVGLLLLHRRWKAERWPFRMWLYPLPVLIAIAGWIGIFLSTGRVPMLASLAAAGVGILVYLGRALLRKQWPMKTTHDQAGACASFCSCDDCCCGVSAFGVKGPWANPGPGVPLAESVEAINQSRVATRILCITAHPDDGFRACFPISPRPWRGSRASHYYPRAGWPERCRPRAGWTVGRNSHHGRKLLAAGSRYGVRQFFSRAVDTGFSKSPEWTMKIWGDQLPMEDMVRVIRTYRPEVVINGWGGTRNSHGQHQATGLFRPCAGGRGH